MRTKIFVPLLMLSLSLLGGCNSPTSNPLEGFNPYTLWTGFSFRVRGTVTDLINGSPIHARVDFLFAGSNRAGADTNDQGQYAIEGSTLIFNRDDLAYNENFFSLVIQAKGYKEKRIKYEDPNHVKYTYDWQTIDVQLEPENKT
jgi:hypothetical protein